MLNRTVAPELKRIETLQHSSCKESMHACGAKIYQAPQRNLGVLRMDIIWTPGSVIQPAKYVCRSAFDLVLKGNEQMGAEEIHEKFEYLGYYTGADVQTFSNQFTLKGGKEEFEEAVIWFSRHFNSASFPNSELANFIQIEQANLSRKMQTPGYWSRRKGLEAIFDANSPMAAFANTEDIAMLTTPMLLDYKQNHMSMQNVSIVLTGDTGQKELDIVNQMLDAVPRSNKTAAIASFQESAYVPAKEAIVHTLEQSNQVSMFIVKRFEEVGETELHKYALLNMLLGGFFGSRLMQEIREEQGLTYGIGSYISQSTDGNLWAISGEMNKDNAWKAWEATREILNDLRNNPVSEEELNKAKSYYAGQLRSSFDGPFSISGKIRHLHTRNYTWNHIDSAMENIWKTTSREICELANNYLHPDSFTTAMAGDI